MQGQRTRETWRSQGQYREQICEFYNGQRSTLHQELQHLQKDDPVEDGQQGAKLNASDYEWVHRGREGVDEQERLQENAFHQFRQDSCRQ